MTLKECYAALGLKQGADLAEIKRAYRRLAFSLHPDLNPHVKDASRRFQIINEAYVTLSHAAAASGVGKTGGSFGARAEEATARAREEAKKAYSKAKQGHEERAASGRPGPEEASKERGKEDVLKDILNDPFARRVFEDIYSHIKDASGSGARKEPPKASPSDMRQGARVQPSFGNGTPAHTDENGMLGKVKGWLRKQIDDEQVLRLPVASLVPGARVRLEIQHGFSEKPQVLEITLPKEFTPEKPMRLKGMGRRVGSWKGDLYVRIEPQ